MVADKQDSPLKTGVPSSKRSPSCIRAHVEVAFLSFFLFTPWRAVAPRTVGTFIPNVWNLAVWSFCLAFWLTPDCQWVHIKRKRTPFSDFHFADVQHRPFLGFPELAMFQCWRTGPFSNGVIKGGRPRPVDPSTGSKGNPVKATTTVSSQLDNRQ
jgi:hypothetical protein